MNPDTAFRQDVTIKHVLCPVDFSDQSQRALSHAVVIAAKFNVAATLLHVYEEATFAPPGEDPPLATSTSKRRRAEAEERLESCAQQVAGGSSVVLATRLMVVQDATVVQAILDCARELDSSLIVMGTHGLSGLKRLLLGSTTEGVLRKSTVPVLAVPLGHH